MELLDGSNVETYASGPLEPSLIVALLAQVGKVVSTAHDLGIVHRDLKPANLFLHRRQDGTTVAKVLDFGISKYSSEAQGLDTAPDADLRPWSYRPLAVSARASGSPPASLDTSVNRAVPSFRRNATCCRYVVSGAATRTSG